MRIKIRMKRQQNRYRAFKWGKRKSISLMAEVVFYVTVIVMCAVVSYNLTGIICINSMIAEFAYEEIAYEEIKEAVLTEEMEEICEELTAVIGEISGKKLDDTYIECNKKIFWLTVLIRAGEDYTELQNFDEKELIKAVNMSVGSVEFMEDYDSCIKLFADD